MQNKQIKFVKLQFRMSMYNPAFHKYYPIDAYVGKWSNTFKNISALLQDS